MFKPKITKGPWEWVHWGCSLSAIAGKEPLSPVLSVRSCSSCSETGTNCMLPYKEDSRALVAVPELLDVYKAARVFKEAWEASSAENVIESCLGGLFTTIRRLEERHCDESI